MKEIKDFKSQEIALHFIYSHSAGGWFRDEDDVNTAKRHAMQSAIFIKDILSEIDGSTEEKLDFIYKVIEHISNFKGK